MIQPLTQYQINEKNLEILLANIKFDSTTDSINYGEKLQEKASITEKREELIAKIGSYWYQNLYTFKAELKETLNQSQDAVFAEELWEISKRVNPAALNENWIVDKVVKNSDVIQAHKGFVTKRFNRNGITLNKPYQELKKGSLINIFENSGFQFKKDSDWVYFYGKTYPNDVDDVVRFYFNVNAQILSYEKLLKFVYELLLKMNEAKVSFYFKLFYKQIKYCRADSIVLYVEKRGLLRALKIIDFLNFSPYSLWLRPETPMFSHELWPGIGFAEEPSDSNNNDSFGQSRVNYVTSIVIDFITANKKLPDTQEVIGIINKEYDFENFHLKPKSILPKNLSFKKIDSSQDPIKSWKLDRSKLNHAEAIANQLANQAIWDTKGDKCTWVKATFKNKDIRVGTCDDNLFDGLAGIAKFYAQLCVYIPDSFFIEMRDGIIRSLLGCKINLYKSKGFHTGLSGIYASLSYISSLIDMNENLRKEINTKTTEITRVLIEKIKFYLKKSNYLLIDAEIDIIIGILKCELFLKNLDSDIKQQLRRCLIYAQEKGAKNTTKILFCLVKLTYKSHLENPDKYHKLLETQLILENQNIDKLSTTKNIQILEYRLEILEFLITRGGEMKVESALAINTLLKYFSLNYVFINKKDSNICNFMTFDEDTKEYKYGILGLLDIVFLMQELVRKGYLNDTFRFDEPQKIADYIIENYLNFGHFPPAQFGHDFYNPGLYDGIAGVGYFLLQLHDSTTPSLKFSNNS